MSNPKLGTRLCSHANPFASAYADPVQASSWALGHQRKYWNALTAWPLYDFSYASIPSMYTSEKLRCSADKTPSKFPLCSRHVGHLIPCNPIFKSQHVLLFVQHVKVKDIKSWHKHAIAAASGNLPLGRRP